MAARNVFIDTSALYSLLDRNEASHAAVKRSISRILGRGSRLVLTDYIVTEAVNLANARHGHLLGRRILDLVTLSEGIMFEWVGALRFDAAKALFQNRPDQGYSLTDCTSFVLMNELALREALTLDSQFAHEGFVIAP